MQKFWLSKFGKEGKWSNIHPSIFELLFEFLEGLRGGCWSLLQLHLGDRQGTPLDQLPGHCNTLSVHNFSLFFFFRVFIFSVKFFIFSCFNVLFKRSVAEVWASLWFYEFSVFLWRNWGYLNNPSSLINMNEYSEYMIAD